MSLFAPPEERWMALALQEAEAALEEGETPVGAVVLEASSGRLLARAHHQTATLHDPTAHAVMIALTQLASPEEPSDAEHLPADSGAARNPAPSSTSRSGAQRAGELILVTTREPCVMCAGAILLSPAIGRIVFGALEPHLGACGSALDLAHLASGTRSLQVSRGVLESRCLELLRRQRKPRKGEQP